MFVHLVQSLGLDPHFFFMLTVGLWMAAMALTAASTDDLERLLVEAVRDSLALARITEQQAAGYMRIDESQFRKQLRGDPKAHLSLTRLIRLPVTFWSFFGPVLLFIVAKKRWDEVTEPSPSPSPRAVLSAIPRRARTVDGGV